MTELSLLGPLERGEITTLEGTPGTELLVLTMAIAVSYRTGVSIVPGWEPSGSGDVVIDSYEGPSWCAWRSIEQDICDAAGITAPTITFSILNAPHYEPIPEEPIATAFFLEARERDEKVAEVTAKASGRTHLPPLTIVYGLGMDGSPQLYERNRGRTGLFVGAWNLSLLPPQTESDAWAGTYGPIAHLADLRDTVPRLGEFLDRATTAVEPLPSVDRLAKGVADIPQGDVGAFFEAKGIEALRAIWTDGRSEESQRIKAQARDHGITPGALYGAAAEFASDRGITAESDAGDGALGTLFGYAATWEWFEVHETLQGHHMQRFAPTAFTRTIEEDRNVMEVRFQHGWDSRISDTSLGPISMLEPDDYGLRYEVPLVDSAYTRELEPWLATGLYGSSSHFEILADTFVKSPGESLHNPRGIPEHVITEVRMQHFGPGYPPANPTTSAGIRPSTQATATEVQ